MPREAGTSRFVASLPLHVGPVTYQVTNDGCQETNSCHARVRACHAPLTALIPIPPSTQGASLRGALCPPSAQWLPPNFLDLVEKPVGGPPLSPLCPYGAPFFSSLPSVVSLLTWFQFRPSICRIVPFLLPTHRNTTAMWSPSRNIRTARRWFSVRCR